MKAFYKILTLMMVIVMMAPLMGCSSQASEQTGDTLKGTITVSGAFALYPMMVKWGEEYQKIHPDVQFDISAGGAGKGMSDALGGAVDIGMVSRDITPEEEAQGAFWVAVNKDAVFCAINAQNPVYQDIMTKGLTKEIFKGIYITGEITTWGQVVGKPDITDPIHVYTRSDAAGAPDVWSKYLGGKQENLLGIGVYGDPGLLDAVVKDPLGIGYNNLNYIYDANTGVSVSGAAVVPVDINGNGTIDPEETLDTKVNAIDSVASGRYPSPPARALNLVTKGKPSGLLLDFLEWVLGDGQKFIDEVGYIQLPREQIDAQLQKLH
jgi:phosphate transport system substrate-binding protein